MVQIYTGNGKGKTTAALGLIVRMLGNGGKVCLIQFMKSGSYHEIQQLQKWIDVFQFGSGEWVDPQHLTEADLAGAARAVEQAKSALSGGEYDLVVLDEINVAVAWKLIPLDVQLELMRIPARCELVMTGRNATPEAIAVADLVTEMCEIKHYYQKGVPARPGIEF